MHQESGVHITGNLLTRGGGAFYKLDTSQDYFGLPKKAGGQSTGVKS